LKIGTDIYALPRPIKLQKYIMDTKSDRCPEAANIVSVTPRRPNHFATHRSFRWMPETMSLTGLRLRGQPQEFPDVGTKVFPNVGRRPDDGLELGNFQR